MANHSEMEIADIWSGLLEGKTTLGTAFEKVRKAARISAVSINCSPNCNRSCKHCFYGFEAPAGELLSNREWKDVIGGFIDMGVRHFHFSGKEPLMSDTTFDLLDHLCDLSSKYNLNYGLITNGDLVRNRLGKLVAAKLGYLDFSIDGLETENDQLRGEGGYKRTLENLEAAVQSKAANRIIVSSVAHRGNYASISGSIRFLSNDVGVRHFFVQPLQIHGRAKDLVNLALSPANYTELLYAIVRMTENAELSVGTSVVLFVPQSYLRGLLKSSDIVVESLTKYMRCGSTSIPINNRTIAFRFHLSCLAFWRSVQVTADGYYIGCSMALASPNYRDYAVGNVRDLSVANLFRESLSDGSILSKIYNDENVAWCSKLPCFDLCFGGCRVHAHIETGSWGKAQPYCQGGSEVTVDQ